jgi:hypothetical protein
MSEFFVLRGCRRRGIGMLAAQEVGDADARQLAVERTVDGLLFRGRDQRPAALVSGGCDLDVLVVSILNPPIDAFELVFCASRSLGDAAEKGASPP